MATYLVGLLLVLHGAVHLWYVVLSRQLVEFRPEMGWSGRSWILTDLLGDPMTRWLASGLYTLAAVAFVAGGTGLVLRRGWGQPVLVAAAALSAVSLLLYWDGRWERIVEKGLIGLLLSLAVLALWGSTARYRSEIRGAWAQLGSLDSQMAETPWGPIEYARRGDGYPVLVVHGNGGGFDQGLGLAQGYLEQGYQVIAPSRFGYLRSPLPADATPARQAEAFACLLDSLGVRQVAILTSSAGVTASLEFALRYPERVSALILHSPNAPGEVELVLPPKPVFTALLRSDYAFWALTNYFQSTMQALVGVPPGLALTPALDAEVKATLTSVLPISSRAEGMVFDTYVSNPEINTMVLEQVEAPTLVISAVDDPMALHANARGLAERIPTARLLTVAEGGHLLLGHTLEVRSEIARFLQQHVPAAAAAGQ